MKTQIFAGTLVLSLISAPALASDSVGMAASEDISAFDQALSKQRLALPPRAAPEAASLGQRVSAEAKKIGEKVKADQVKNFGLEIASQRRNGNSGTPGSMAADRAANNRGLGNGANSNSNSTRPNPGRGPKKPR